MNTLHEQGELCLQVYLLLLLTDSLGLFGFFLNISIFLLSPCQNDSGKVQKLQQVWGIFLKVNYLV